MTSPQKTQDSNGSTAPDAGGRRELVRDTTLPVMRERVESMKPSVSHSLVSLYTAVLSLCKKMPVPTVKRQRLYAIILMVCQGGITFTGSLVRVTGSGPGCDTGRAAAPSSRNPAGAVDPPGHRFGKPYADLRPDHRRGMPSRGAAHPAATPSCTSPSCRASASSCSRSRWHHRTWTWPGGS